MLNLKKLVIGIRPASKMFRLDSVGGQLVDEIFELRGTDEISHDFFTNVSYNAESINYKINNELMSHGITLSTSDITYEENLFDQNKKIKVKEFIKQFERFWKVINKSLEMRDIRRIGIYGEYLFPLKYKNPSQAIAEKFLTHEGTGVISKANIRFEERNLSVDRSEFNIDKDAFENTIYTIWDGEIDAQHATENTIFIGVDTQTYFNPLKSKVSITDLHNLSNKFTSKSNEYLKSLLFEEDGDV